MKPRIPATGGLALLMFAATAFAGATTPFSAELVDTHGGQTTTGTFHYQDKGYRYEFGDKDQQLIIIVDGSSGRMRLISPKERSYIEAGPDEPLSLFANPFGAYAHLSATKQIRTEGNEAIGGVSCKKQVVHSDEQVFVTGWVSDDYAVPLKVQMQLDGHTIELRNLKRGPQDPALFVLPAGYRLNKQEEEPPKQPEWASKVARAPVATPPFERKLSAEAIVRVRPRAGSWISIAGTNLGEKQGSFMSAPFKQGKLVDASSMSTVVIDPKDSSAMTTGVTPDHADELIIRVVEGTFAIKVTFVAPPRTGPGSVPAAEAPSSEPPVEVTASVNAPPDENAAAPVLVSWMGPANRDDFITIALPAHPPGRSVNRAWVRDGNPAKLWAPSDPGEYEVRYILGRGPKLLAKAPITIKAVTATVKPPATVKAGTEFEVAWQGPGYPEDSITVARPNQVPGGSVASMRIKPGGSLKLRAPREPGTYEVRYVLGRGPRLLTKEVLTVTAP